MSRNVGLDSQSTKINVVIRKNVYIDKNKIKSFLEGCSTEYAFIEHEKDITPSGELEGVHYHLVFNANKNRVRLSKRLNDIVSYFGFDNPFGIQIEPYRSYEGALQYLIHKNQPEKTQHDISEVITNIDKGDFNTLMNCEVSNVITFDRLYASILSASNIVEVIKDIGIGNYRTWRNVIGDIWKEIKQ